MRALQLLNAMEGTTKVIITLNIRLMYLDILINRRFIIAMVDTSIIYNFVSVEEAKRLGLTIENGDLHMKVMNSEAKSIHEMACDMTVKVES